MPLLQVQRRVSSQKIGAASLLSTIPTQVQYGKVLEVFHSERECVIKHDEFFNKAQRENQPIAPSFNLSCVPLKENKKWTKPSGSSNANVTVFSSNENSVPV